MSPKLKKNGGNMEIGDCNTCRKKGYGVGSKVKIHETEFLKEWSNHYEPIVQQQLWYKQGTPLPGYQRATLHNCFNQGFAAASLRRAEKLRKQIGQTGAKKVSRTQQMPKQSNSQRAAQRPTRRLVGKQAPPTQVPPK